MKRVGLVSDTHGLLRREVEAFLAGSDLILHAGDIDAPEVLEALGRIAPLTAVRGNNDRGAWAETLHDSETLQIEQVKVLVLHDLKSLGTDPVAARIQVVVAGHSHHPAVVMRDGVLYVNPGSAGPRRFRLPIAAGELFIDGDKVTARVMEF